MGFTGSGPRIPTVVELRAIKDKDALRAQLEAWSRIDDLNRIIVPASAFRLLSGEEKLDDYQFDRKMIHHRFCTRCGISPFGTDDIEQIGRTFYAIHVGCLNNVTSEKLLELPVRHEDFWQDD